MNRYCRCTKEVSSIRLRLCTDVAGAINENNQNGTLNTIHGSRIFARLTWMSNVLPDS